MLLPLQPLHQDHHSTLSLSSSSSTQADKDGGLVASLLSGLDAPAITTYVSLLRKQFINGTIGNTQDSSSDSDHVDTTTQAEKQQIRIWTADALFALCRNTTMPGHSDWAPGVRQFLFCQAFFRCTNTKGAPESTPDAALEGGQSPVLPATSPVRAVLSQRTLSLISAGASDHHNVGNSSSGAEEVGAGAIVSAVRDAAFELHNLWKAMRRKKLKLARPLGAEAETTRKSVDSLMKSIKTSVKRESVRHALEALVLLFEIQLLFNETTPGVGHDSASTVSDDAAADLMELVKIMSSECGLITKPKKKAEKASTLMPRHHKILRKVMLCLNLWMF